MSIDNIDTTPVGTSTISLSDLMSDSAQGDNTSERGVDTSGNGDYQLAPPNLSPQSGLGGGQGNAFSPSAQTQATALGSQSLQGGLARGYYQSAVDDLGSADGLMRSILKAETRALSPPIARAFLNAARPGLGPQSAGSGLSGLMNDPVLQNYTGGTLGSANVTNASANLIGAGARVVGAGLVGFSVVSAISQTIASDNPLQTGLTQTGQLAGSLAGGYAAGEVAAAVATVAGEVVVAVVGVAAAPYVAVGATLVALGATVWGAQNGAVAGFKLAEEFYEKLSH
jgi:hypothetical protein